MGFQELWDRYEVYLEEMERPIPDKEKYFLACIIADLCEEMFGVDSIATIGWRSCALRWQDYQGS